MEYWAEVWNELLNILSDNRTVLIKNPLVWVFIALAAIGIYALYDVPDRVNKNGLGSVVRQLLQVLLDTSSDIINALRSITGFLGVLRLLLFGKINQRTLQVLINYAIIFMSMASFTTTFSGLREMVGMVLAAFISFGVQVGILICAVKIANSKDIERGEAEKVVTIFKYNFIEQSSYIEEPQKLYLENTGHSEKKDINEGKNKTDASDGESTQNSSKIKIFSEKEKSSEKKKRGCSCFILAISLLVSSSFSYSFMFEKFISPHLAMDDHFRSIREVQNIILNYSEELSQYRSNLVGLLTRYNDNIEEWMDLKENSPYVTLEQETRLEDELEELKKERDQISLESYEAEDGSPEKNVAEDKLSDLEFQIGTLEGNLEDLRAKIYEDPIESSRTAAYKSITALTDFYANPGEISEERERELRQDFSYLQQSEAAFQNATVSGQETGIDDDARTELVNAFENYVLLSKFLEEQGGGRISFTEVQEKINIDYSKDISDNDYRNTTNEILLGMINKLNSIPMLPPVKNVWSRGSIQTPSQSEYMEVLNKLYRDNNGTVLLPERAVKKLFGWNGDKESAGVGRMLFLLAVIFDGIIVALTMFRERKYSYTNNSELQRLIGILFIDDSIGRESERQKKSHSLCLTLGFLAGILIFTIYQVGGYADKKSFQQNTFSLICFIAVGLIMGMLIYKIYYKAYHKLHGWEQETIYHKWMEIFLPDEESEKRLKEKFEQIKHNEIKVSWLQNAENIENILAFWMSTSGKRLFLRYFYPGFVLLFEEIEMKKCVKTSINKELREGKYTDIESLTEEINLPCLQEDKVANAGAKIEFSILKRRHLVEFAFEKNNENSEKGFYILTERFWYLLYDAILLRIAGGRITEHDIEEELWDGNDEEDQL